MFYLKIVCSNNARHTLWIKNNNSNFQTLKPMVIAGTVKFVYGFINQMVSWYLHF